VPEHLDRLQRVDYFCEGFHRGLGNHRQYWLVPFRHASRISMISQVSEARPFAIAQGVSFLGYSSLDERTAGNRGVVD
jgi:hypothetical protein